MNRNELGWQIVKIISYGLAVPPELIEQYNEARKNDGQDIQEGPGPQAG